MLSVALFTFACSVGIGTKTAENHPKLNWQLYTSKGSSSQVSGEVVLDSNWRWTHDGNGKNCYDGNSWISSLCPDDKTCSEKCVLDGADYQGTYGIQSNGTAITLKFVTHGSYSTNIGSRLYLLKDSKTYYVFKLNNKEFTFSVDVSKLPCGLNGALYFVSMDADGGAAKYSGAKPGAQYGLGYCDAQCPSDLKFINGEANSEGWKPQDNDKNAGNGKYGSCCSEMDVWEANSQAAAVTPHVCKTNGQQRCSGTSECGGQDGTARFSGLCDEDGCDFNSWRQGDKTFYGPGLTVDTKSPFVVVTQFYGSPVTEIRRKYVQNGKVIENSKSNIPGIDATNAISDKFCDQQKTAFGDNNDFKTKGGFTKLGSVFDQGMVLVLSLWDDHQVAMLWLDSAYPTNKDKSTPGVDRGPCSTSSGKPNDVESQSGDSTVVYGNIKFGPLDSTY
jgi:cellulose 1,4-beta-cellobiosidase